MNSGMDTLRLRSLVLGLLVLAWFSAGCASRTHTRPEGANASTASQTTNDPYLWLEDVTGDKALAWAREQNALSTRFLTNTATFEPVRRRLLAILDSKERIPFAQKLGPYLYNFWRDDRNVRGLLRRTSLEEYREAEPRWETVIDLDQLAAAENENWVWHGFDPLYPDYDRCLVSLSRGGADATVVREFDLTTKSFVVDGFTLPEAKSQVSWRDRDTVYVGTDFGPGSLTSSGYPRIVKEWRRHTPLAEARAVFEGKDTDVSVGAYVDHDRGYTYDWIQRGITFYTSEVFLRIGDRLEKIDKPEDAEIGTHADQILITLRSDWTIGGRTYPAGALLATGLDAYRQGKRKLEVLFEPTPRKSLAGTGGTRNHLIVNELENVRNRLYLLTLRDGQWQRQAMEVPAFGTVGVSGVDPDHSDEYWLTVTDFLTPSSLWHGTIGQGAPEKLKSLPAFFRAEGLRIEQFEATSKDGTRVPYFQVGPANLKAHGKNPTLLNGYGGFEISMLSSYNASVGAAWLERGHVYVLANTRGGGEFGPKWHQAALKENRQRAYDDFIGIAEDLVRRRVTSPRHLGIIGGSNGGLLMGNMLVQRPDLFGAIVCQVPLLDMKRYSQLLAGASWMGEYGNPDLPEEWAFLQRYSPYHLVRADRKYPRVFFTTSTRDDRVHPGHARKMVAKMKDQGHGVLYYENIEGGHGGAANNPQRAFMQALAYAYLEEQLAGR